MGCGNSDAITTPRRHAGNSYRLKRLRIKLDGPT
jgi:hypothetical protein